ncbi:MAG: hypothetical protein P4M02_09700 [Clostridia bacterium]|nr:hypothetical protein [Clostridia bacterium]
MTAQGAATKPPPVFSHAFRLLRGGGVLLDAQEAESQILDEAVTVAFGSRSMTIGYRDILCARAENYRVIAELRDGTQAEFYYLGHFFDSFSEDFLEKYNAVVKKDSFMAGEAVCVRSGACFSHAGPPCEKGECDLLLDAHAVTIQRIGGAPAKLPYAMIDSVDYRQYDFSIAIYGDRWDFSMLGHEYGSFKTQYAKCYGALVAQADAWLAALASGVPEASMHGAAELFLDGRPVARPAAERLAPGLWAAVFNKACELSAKEYFEYLAGNADSLEIGFKDSLYEAGGSFIWLMARMGKHIVFEAVSSGQTGMATYLYHIQNDAQETMRLINYCMHMTEFRREPVYLSEKELDRDENAGYRDALLRVPQINTLRGLYDGRLMHTAFESWEKSLRAKTQE